MVYVKKMKPGRLSPFVRLVVVVGVCDDDLSYRMQGCGGLGK